MHARCSLTLSSIYAVWIDFSAVIQSGYNMGSIRFGDCSPSLGLSFRSSCSSLSYILFVESIARQKQRQKDVFCMARQVDIVFCITCMPMQH